MESSSAAVVGIILGIFIVYFLIFLALYILGSFAHHKMFKKAGVKYPWLAWIPLASYWPYMWTIKKSAWNILWLLVPVANTVFAVIWMVKLYKAFGVSPHWLWLMLVPSAGVLFIFIQFCYMGFSSKVQYQLRGSVSA